MEARLVHSLLVFNAVINFLLKLNFPLMSSPEPRHGMLPWRLPPLQHAQCDVIICRYEMIENIQKQFQKKKKRFTETVEFSEFFNPRVWK